MKRSFQESFFVPIYGVRVYLNVSPNVYQARVQQNHIFGELEETDGSEPEGWFGICASSGNYYGQFFDGNELRHGQIAHEILHLTHRILQDRDVVFSPVNHEPFTYLCQWLTDEIYYRLKKRRVRIQ